MRGMLVAVAVLGMVLCGLFAPADDAGAAAPKSDSVHTRLWPITGASVAHSENLTIAPDGTVSLKRGDRGDFLQDLPVTTVGSLQKAPGMAVNSKDEFVIAWQDFRDDDGDIYAQRLDNKGNRLGPEIEVCAAVWMQHRPIVTFDSQDNFIVVWGDLRTLTDEIHAQMFDPSGNRRGGEMIFPGSDAYARYDICADPEGGFTVVYSFYDHNTDGRDIHAARFDMAGQRLGPDIVVCADAGDQFYPTAAILPSGDCLVAWEEANRPSGWLINSAIIDGDTGTCGDIRTTWKSDNGASHLEMKADRSGNCLLAFYTPSEIGWAYDTIALWVDANGERKGTSVSIPGGLGMEGFASIALDARDRFVLCWQCWNSTIDRVSLRATILDPSTRAAGQLMHLGTGQWNESVPVLAMDSCNGFLVAWTDGREAAHSLYSRKCYYPAASQGNLITADIAPDSFYKWNRLEIRQAMQSRAANYMYINYSTDGGKSWVPLPPNGSLDRAGRAPAIRIKVDMGTYDYSTSPVLSSIALNYTMNTLPSVSAAGPLSAWRNKPTTIDVRGSDGDNDSLTYKWEQIAGPPVAGTNTSGPSLPVDTGRPGTYRFRVWADDGWNISLPCDVVLSVVNHGPSLSCPGDPVEISRGGMVSIKAVGSDVDGDRVRILWSQKSGSPKLFENYSGTELRFIATCAGDYRIQSIAFDGANYSAPVLILVSVDDPVAAEAAGQGQTTVVSFAASAMMIAAAATYLFLRRRKSP